MDIMIDLETGSTEINAAIFSIGALAFEPTNTEPPSCTFYVEISHASNKASKRDFSTSTMEWWAGQPTPPPNGSTGLFEALQALSRWLPPAEAVWANSPGFDLSILKHAFNHFDLNWPYPFWKEADVRTLKRLLLPGYTLGNDHHALKDAMRQTVMVREGYKRLNLYTQPVQNPWIRPGAQHDHHAPNPAHRS